MQTDCFPDAISEWSKGPMSKLAVVNPRYPMKKGQEYPFVEMASIGENFAGILGFEARSLEGSGLTRFRVNDTLFAKITPCPQNGKVAFVASIPGDVGLASTEFIVLSPRSGTVPRYLYHLACSHDVRGRAAARMEGSTGRQRVPEEVFTKRLLVPIPDPDEQAAIARILDAAEMALERTRAAVERAREVKRACLGDFFYEALGDVAYADRPKQALPRGWTLVPTRRLLAEDPKNGWSPESSTQPPGIPSFSIAAIRDGRVNLEGREHLKYARVEEKLAERYRVRRGDVLIVRGNASPDLVGMAGMVNDFPDGCIYPDIAMRVAFRTIGEPRVRSAFAVLAWNHPIVHNQVLRRAKTSNGTLKINSRDVNQIVVPVPPDEKQAEICGTIETVDRLIDALTAVGRAQQELKKSLMHDLLTGRVRVRDTSRVAVS